MKYISTKQTAEAWGISQRRVTMLAASGKLEGAVLMDNRWLIPENTPRPADLRTKSGRASEHAFASPFPISYICDDRPADSLSPEEAELYRIDLLYEQGEFRQAEARSLQLLNTTENPYIRLGVLYLLPYLYLYLMDFDAVAHYTFLFKTAFYSLPQHREELRILLMNYDAEFSDFQEILNSFDVRQLFPCAECMFPSVAIYNILIEYLRCSLNGSTPNVLSHELICRLLEEKGLFYASMLIHEYLSVMYGGLHKRDKELEHARRAIDIALQKGTVFTLSSFLPFDKDMSDTVLSAYPAEVQEHFHALSSLYVRARNAFTAYNSRRTPLSGLDMEDYSVISCCLKDFSVGQMAESFGLSTSGMKKRLAILYRKLGVSSKKELTSVFLNESLNVGKKNRTES